MKKMKNENQPSKNSRNMSTKNVSTEYKKLQPFLSALTNFVVDIVEETCSRDDSQTVKECMSKRQQDLVNLIQNNLLSPPTSQKNTLQKVKDPNAPKRAKSGYILFCIDKREEIKNDNPEMSGKEILKELGRVWREDLPDNIKDMYNKKSEDDKVRYKQEMTVYTPPDLGFVATSKKNAKREGPKKALSSYIFFCKEYRQILKNEESGLSPKEITSALGAKWKSLSDKDKTPFNKLSEQDKKRYTKEKAKWDKDQSTKSVK